MNKFSACAVTVAVFTLCSSKLVAAPITIEAVNVADVTALPTGSALTTAGFLLGENVNLLFTIDDGSPDSATASGIASFSDTTGTISLVGQTSGATYTSTAGTRLRVADAGTFRFQSDNSATSGFPFGAETFLFGDENPGDDLFSDVDSLPTVLSEILGTHMFLDVESDVRFREDDGSSAIVLSQTGHETVTFQLATTNNQVPEPSTLAIWSALGLMLGAAVIRRVAPKKQR